MYEEMIAFMRAALGPNDLESTKSSVTLFRRRSEHSQKALLREADTPIELKVLMEADLLDETGALGVLWDCLVQGQKPEQSYAATYQHIVDFTAQSLKTNPMVSTKGKRIWEQKRRLVEAFLESLEQDLFVGNQLWGVPRGR